MIIDLLERQYKIKIEAVTEKFDDTPAGHLMRAVMMFMNETERNKIVYKTNRGRKDRAENNLTDQGLPKYGYRYVNGNKYNRARYEIDDEIIYTDPEGAQWSYYMLVRYVFDSVLSGMGLRAIAIRLTQLGVPTRKGKKNWNFGTIYQIATSDWYTGENIRVFRLQREKQHVSKRPVEEQILLPDGLVPAIVSLSQFQAVQEQLAYNRTNANRNNHDPETGIMRNGYLKCGICGRTLHVKHHTKVYRGSKPNPPEYFCARKTGLEDSIHNHALSIYVHNVDALAWNLVCEYNRCPEKVRAQIDAFREEKKQQDPSLMSKQPLRKSISGSLI